jgi:hypothetical protein
MGKWLKKFSDTRTDSVATVDRLSSVSTVSVPDYRHSEIVSGDSAVLENPNSRTDNVDTIDILNSKSLLGNTDNADTLGIANSGCAHFSTDSVDTLYRTSTVSVPECAHPESCSFPSNIVAEPDTACPDCGSGQWWQLFGQAWHCRQCEPDMPLTATTLTLPCHKAQVPPVGSHAGLDRMIEIAYEGLSITPVQLRQELEQGGDIPDLQSGALTLQVLRLTARTLALMRYPNPPEPRVIGTTVYGVRVVSEG